MARNKKKRHRTRPGLSPGTVIHVGEKRMEQVGLSEIRYDAEGLKESPLRSVDEAAGWKESPGVVWISVDGLHDALAIEKLGEIFGLHPLLLEDLVNTEQRPKLDDYENYLFVVLKLFHLDEESGRLTGEQVSLVLGERFLLSFQEHPLEVFENVRVRLRGGKGRIRKSGPDYLAYALIDSVVDHYFVVLERLGEVLEELEGRVIESPTTQTLEQIHHLKREMILLRRSVWPLREVANALLREDPPLIQEQTKVYLRDVYDHTIQVIDTLEAFRDILTGMLDVYLSSASNRLNEVMKVLTIIATIFIPLTFVAGVYGMNFEFMPELEVWWAYPAVLGLMLLTALAMVGYFRRKGWF